jgi:hypothetical protein
MKYRLRLQGATDTFERELRHEPQAGDVIRGAQPLLVRSREHDAHGEMIVVCERLPAPSAPQEGG